MTKVVGIVIKGPIVTKVGGSVNKGGHSNKSWANCN